MTVLRSERLAAVLLLAAAALGLALANSPWSESLLALRDLHVGIPGTALDLSLGHWVSDGLLVVFFFVAAIELKHELVAGELNSIGRAIRPAIAAAGGVLVPAVIYLAMTAGSGFESGWPVPTATDIAFALGILAVFGKGLPARIRIFLLALAILDDIVAIVIIALFFTQDPNLLAILGAAVCVAAFGALSRVLIPGGRPVPSGLRALVVAAIIALAIGAWILTLASGVHATIAGVALGLAMAHKPGQRTRHAIEPFSNGVVLPVFAFTASLVLIPQVPLDALAPPFWAILVALPVGKIIGIGIGGWLAGFVGRRGSTPRLGGFELLTAGALGGIGFTVSLLMSELAFAGSVVRDEGTLAVLLGSSISIVIASVLVSLLARRYRHRERVVV